MNESDFSRDLRKSFEARYGPRLYMRKIVASQFSMIGIPDIIGCMDGKFIAIECKQIKKKPTREASRLWHEPFSQPQLDNLLAIKSANGSAYGVIHLPFLKACLVLTPESIRALPSPSLLDIQTLYKTRRHLFIHRVGGHWTLDPFIPLVPSTTSVVPSDS